jgi:hypothetical protein
MLVRSLVLASVASLVVPLVGCGAGSTTANTAVTGKLLNNGAPLTVQGQQIGLGRIELHFIPTFPGGTSRMTLVHADGKFSLDQAGEFTPGKYKLAVYALEPAKDPSAVPTAGGMVDRLEGAFSKDNTPIEREIAAGADLGEIDLATFPKKSATTQPAKR